MKTCSDDGSFTIIANTTGEPNGCYVEAGITAANGEIFYTVSGTMNTSEVVVIPIGSEIGNVSNYCRSRIACNESHLGCIFNLREIS